MEAIKNLQPYQNEMRSRRDKKMKQKSIKAQDLVLLLRPHMEASRK
jgi:hypothetical protein